jgi:hypothetical protein
VARNLQFKTSPLLFGETRHFEQYLLESKPHSGRIFKVPRAGKRCDVHIVEVRFVSASSPLIYANILRDTHKPTLEVPCDETVNVLICTQKRFLSSILRRTRLLQENPTRRIHSAAMSLEELPKAFVVTVCAEIMNQLFI